VSALEDEVRRIVAEELARRGVTAPSGAYDAEHLPPTHTSVEAFNLECRRLRFDPIIYKIGRGWRIPRDEWERARREDRERRRGPRTELAADPIDAQLVRAGLRLVRGPR
jgi:hypothetical protein